jgi:hypothetical protein
MNKYLLLGAMFLALPLSLFAQGNNATTDAVKDTATWTKSGAIAVDFGTVAVDNWAGGGQNSISVGLLLSGQISRATKKSLWESYGSLTLGGARVGESSTNLFKKTKDIFIIGTKYGYRLSPNWSIPIGLELRTQLLNGYTFKKDLNGNEVIDQKTSAFLSSGILNVGAGIEYNYILANPEKKINTLNLSASFMPVSQFMTLVANKEIADLRVGGKGIYTPNGEQFRAQLGAIFRNSLEWNPWTNVSFVSKFSAFSPYEDLARINFTWDPSLVLRVNKYITTSFIVNVVYNNDQIVNGKQYITQYQHALNINFGVKF